jgi:hypothetical protein
MEPPNIDSVLGTSSWDRYPSPADSYAKQWFASGLKIRAKYQLPEGLVCDHCVVQWWWVTANTCYAPGYHGYGWPTQDWWKGW